MNIFIDHVGDGHKYYRMAIISILYNECLRRRCFTKRGNVAQVQFYNIDNQSNNDDFPDGEPTEWSVILTLRISFHSVLKLNDLTSVSSDFWNSRRPGKLLVFEPHSWKLMEFLP